MKLTSTLALLCTLLCVADGSSASTTYFGDRFANTQVALGSLFSLVYLILSAVCIYVLVLKGSRRTGAYFTLFFTLAFQALTTIFNVFSNVLDNGGFVVPSNSSYGPTNIAFVALGDFFSYWAYSGIFLCIYLLIHERHIVIKPVSMVIPTIYYILFGLLVIFGITATGLSIDYVHLLFDPAELIGGTVSKVLHKAMLANDLAYTFNSIWYFASLCLIMYAVYVHRELRRISVHDAIMNSILFLVIPLYTLLNVESLTFTILNSPAGIKYNLETVSGRNQFEGVQVAATVLSNVFFISVSIAILALGLSDSRWDTGKVGGATLLNSKDYSAEEKS